MMCDLNVLQSKLEHFFPMLSPAVRTACLTKKKQQLVRVTFISKPQGVFLFFSLIQITHHIWALIMNPVIKLLMLVLIYLGSHPTIILTQR